MFSRLAGRLLRCCCVRIVYGNIRRRNIVTFYVMVVANLVSGRIQSLLVFSFYRDAHERTSDTHRAVADILVPSSRRSCARQDEVLS